MLVEPHSPGQVDVLRENDLYVESLQTAVDRGEFSLDNLPALVLRVIQEDRWSHRYVRALQREIQFASFTEFSAAKMPAGLGTSVAMLKRMCRDNRSALDALDRAMQGKPGNREGVNQYTKESVNVLGGNDNNVNGSARPVGNASDYALRKLREARPDLHARVLAGELSPHAAMVEAGFRKKTISIPVTDPERAAKSIRTNMLPDDIRVLVEYLEGF